MASAGFDCYLSDRIVQEMWEKWVFLAALAGSTYPMRTTIGDILQAAGGAKIVLDILDECRLMTHANGHLPRPRAGHVDHSRLPSYGFSAA